MMPSRIYMICDRYESGYGHGVKNDGLDLSKTPHADPELGEAYKIGYEAGQEIRTLGQNQIEELKQQRDELLAAAENLIQVKGRHHTEQAYKQLEAAIAKVKEQK